MQLNPTQMQMRGNTSEQQHSPLTSMQCPNMQSNPAQLQTRAYSDLQRPIQANLNDTQYQWGPTSNINQPQRNDQMPVGS